MLDTEGSRERTAFTLRGRIVIVVELAAGPVVVFIVGASFGFLVGTFLEAWRRS